MKRFFFSALLLLSPLIAEENRPTAITYEFSGGRMGDNLVAYLHAKWLSYKYQVPLYTRFFNHANEFAFNESEEKLTEEVKSQFGNVLTLDTKNPLLLKSETSTLFYLPFYQDDVELKRDPQYQEILPDWDDPEFKSLIQQNLRLVHPPKGFKLPNNRITVAVHVRKGCGPDTPDVHLSDPLKFPPNSFYIEQIIRAYYHFKRQPLYIHVFSDVSQPQLLADEFAKATQGLRIEYQARDHYQRYLNTMMEDFSMMTQFDCIIHPTSNFSFVAAKISNCKLEIFPTHAVISNNKVKIDRVETLIH